MSNLNKNSKVGDDHDDEWEADADEDDNDGVGWIRRPTDGTDRLGAYKLVARPAYQRRKGTQEG